MYRILIPLCAAGLLLVPPVGADDYPRNWAVDVVHYRFHLTLTDAADGIEGRAEITVRFLEAGIDEFFLDLVGKPRGAGAGMEVLSVARDGGMVEHLHSEDRLRVFMADPSEAGERRTYAVVYSGIPDDGLIIGTNKFGHRTFFGDNWPDRARHWLPTVDHVSDKATVEWLVTAPGHYEVIGNGRLVERSDLGDGTELTHWASTVPIPPKVMVIGVARFAMRNSAYVDGIPVQSWVYPEDRIEGFYDYALAEKALRFFHGHVGPYPYAKLANVQSTTRYGGMENASNVFYSEGSVRGDRGSEGLIVHEIAHQWFGDSVTELDWNHLWLSEGFATYLTHLYNEFTHGRDRLVEGMLRNRETVVRFFEEKPELALIALQLTDPNDMLNRNAYQKGGWLLHMLRRQVGDEAFWDGVRTYYRVFRDQNALTEDFRQVMEEISGQELEWFFDQWAYRAGHPVLSSEWSYDSSTGEATITIGRFRMVEPSFRFPLDIGIVGADETMIHLESVDITELVHTFSVPLDAAPSGMILDPNTWLLFAMGSQLGRSGATEPTVRLK